MKKKFLVYLLVAALFVGLVGCGGSGGDSNSDSGDVAKEDVKVAILIPSSPTDGGWGQVGADGTEICC
jgi:ABC-type glycerol-3-phosphate transport system substrate-binding protein